MQHDITTILSHRGPSRKDRLLDGLIARMPVWRLQSAGVVNFLGMSRVQGLGVFECKAAMPTKDIGVATG